MSGGAVSIFAERKAMTAQQRAEAAKTLLEHGGDRKSENANQDSNTTLNGRGTEYLAARIKRDHPEVHERMKAGAFPTVVDVLAKNAPKGKGGPKTTTEETNRVRGLIRGSDTKPVLQAKLAEHHPEVWSDFLAGNLPSVRAAAVTSSPSSRASRRVP